MKASRPQIERALREPGGARCFLFYGPDESGSAALLAAFKAAAGDGAERVQLAGTDKGRFRILMNRLREQMQYAESLGYGGFCMTEQHMQVEGIESTTNPLFWDYFVAQHTKTMRVGQLGMNLTVVNPIQLAEDIALIGYSLMK